MPVAALLLGLHASPGLAWQVDNRVVIEYGELVIDHAKTVAQITQAQDAGGFRASVGLGLFQNKMNMELVLNPVDVAKQGKRLSLVTTIKTAPVIYVASELPAGTCAYQVVLNHEMQHQRFDRLVLRTLPDEARRLAREVFNDDLLERADEANLARARGLLLQRLKFTYDALSYPLHQGMDNPESYAELGGRCQGEIGRLLAANVAGK